MFSLRNKFEYLLCFVLYLPSGSRSSMDRIPDSGSGDMSSNLVGNTNRPPYQENKAAIIFLDWVSTLSPWICLRPCSSLQIDPPDAQCPYRVLIEKPEGEHLS